MAKKPARKLKVGRDGEIKLPPDVLEALEVEPGGELEFFLDTRRKQLRLERHVDDPWGEALKKKPEKGFEDVLSEQAQRESDAAKLFDQKLKEPPPKRKPEDDPDHWR